MNHVQRYLVSSPWTLAVSFPSHTNTFYTNFRSLLLVKLKNSKNILKLKGIERYWNCNLCTPEVLFLKNKKPKTDRTLSMTFKDTCCIKLTNICSGNLQKSWSKNPHVNRTLIILHSWHRFNCTIEIFSLSPITLPYIDGQLCTIYISRLLWVWWLLSLKQDKKPTEKKETF